jgi:hypothetical protein
MPSARLGATKVHMQYIMLCDTASGQHVAAADLGPCPALFPAAVGASLPSQRVSMSWMGKVGSCAIVQLQKHFNPQLQSL